MSYLTLKPLFIKIWSALSSHFKYGSRKRNTKFSKEKNKKKQQKIIDKNLNPVNCNKCWFFISLRRIKRKSKMLVCSLSAEYFTQKICNQSFKMKINFNSLLLVAHCWCCQPLPASIVAYTAWRFRGRHACNTFR